MKEFLAMVLVLCLLLGACCILYIQVDQRAATAESQNPSNNTILPSTGGTTEPSRSTTAPVESTSQPPTQPTEPDPTESEPTEPEPTGPEPTEPEPIIPLELSARYAFAYDVAAGEFIYTHGDLQDAISPASITKLFTAYVALQILSPETVVTVGSEISLIDPHSSVAGLTMGEQLTVEQLVAGMLLPSGNDAAYTLAVAAGRSLAEDATLDAEVAMAVFMDAVTDHAQDMGLENTQFRTPDGNDLQGHYSCAQDLLSIALLVHTDTIIRRYTQMVEFSFTSPSGARYNWINSNLLLHENSPYYCPQAIGLKTGSTDLAGRCLISMFEHDGRQIIICVMGCDTHEQRYEDTLLLWGVSIS